VTIEVPITPAQYAEIKEIPLGDLVVVGANVNMGTKSFVLLIDAKPKKATPPKKKTTTYSTSSSGY